MSWPRSLSRIRRTFRAHGILGARGWRRLRAFTSMRERGTRTPATATWAGCSFSRPPGAALAVEAMLRGLLPASSSIAPGSSTGVTDTDGGSATAGSGETPRERAD